MCLLINWVNLGITGLAIEENGSIIFKMFAIWVIGNINVNNEPSLYMCANALRQDGSVVFTAVKELYHSKFFCSLYSFSIFGHYYCVNNFYIKNMGKSI